MCAPFFDMTKGVGTVKASLSSLFCICRTKAGVYSSPFFFNLLLPTKENQKLVIKKKKQSSNGSVFNAQPPFPFLSIATKGNRQPPSRNPIYIPSPPLSSPSPPLPPSPSPFPSPAVVVAASPSSPADSAAVVVAPSASSPADSSQRKPRQLIIIILGSILGAFFVVFVVVGFCFYLFRNKGESKELDEFSVDQVPGIPTRFSYKDLRAMTCNFNDEIGKGGFGSVFQGKLNNGTKIAVKHLNGFDHVKKSFLAEVETIGSIHHVNLVRLIGFCAEKSNRLLVYEYMSKGSLDTWIFHRHQDLGWQSRKKIIMDIAKGLKYLHEECRQKILHLDIKPQNILLDEDFNAKISDFGLSKLIDKDKSQVETRMKGTLGYLPPECLKSIFSEKVDVYSFGVVVLEMLCGRKNLDSSQPEDLLDLFKRKAEEEHLMDIVDKCNDDMQTHREEVVKMMRVAVWCLQSDFSRRPSMSVVVKVLEGSVEVENNLGYDFTTPVVRRANRVAGNQEDATGATASPSVLSGPR
ncbi:probable receptor-like protein kinase At5g20050 [Camellia sinensis]|uniref:probable receptor-like protein kinase At5g20050 n=1 Tax=Camellia sinensis TaxID=4442 RepID=UPI001035627A|nr:probable receptor-like protein kinase At5g20050 [Camellia sinensis]